MASDGKKFNLFEDTKHESGIIVFSDDSVLVSNWAACSDNCIPAQLGPITLSNPYPTESTLQMVRDVDDIRKEFPGTIWKISDDELDTDMDIIDDCTEELPKMFGFKGYADTTPCDESDYSGKVWLLDDLKILTINCWC